MTIVYGLSNLPAGSDLDQHQLLKIDDGQLVPTAAANDAPIGLCPVSAESGEGVSPQRGICVPYAIAAGEIAVGVKLEPAAGGRVAEHDEGTAFAMALDAASEAGDLIRIEFQG